jgi:mannose-6-phosphate isomerase-like protein (cupin superfamily)
MNPETTKRPWGSFTRFTNNEPSTVKLLYINKGEELSLQYHIKRDEFWRVISGSPEITLGEDKFDAREGQEFNIGAEVKHKIAAPYDDVVILEIATGDFDEHDIVRLEDKYGRV